MNGLEALKEIKNGDFITCRTCEEKQYNGCLCCRRHLSNTSSLFNTIEKELKDYYEIKEIAKHYNFDDLGRDVYKAETDRKWQLKFDAGIVSIQEDYKKARVLDVLKRISHYDIHFLNYLLSEGKITKEEYEILKKVLL